MLLLNVIQLGPQCRNKKIRHGIQVRLNTRHKELRQIYKKRVVVIPPHKPLIRNDQKDLFFKNAQIQYEEAVKEVLEPAPSVQGSHGG